MIPSVRRQHWSVPDWIAQGFIKGNHCTVSRPEMGIVRSSASELKTAIKPPRWLKTGKTLPKRHSTTRFICQKPGNHRLATQTAFVSGGPKPETFACRKRPSRAQRKA